MITEHDIKRYAMVFCEYLENLHAFSRMLRPGLQGEMTLPSACSLCSLKPQHFPDGGAHIAQTPLWNLGEEL